MTGADNKAERAENPVSGSGAVRGSQKNGGAEEERELSESGGRRIGFNVERQNGRSRSAHMLCSLCGGQLTRLIFAGVSLNDAIIKPHMGDRHPVLRQRASFV